MLKCCIHSHLSEVDWRLYQFRNSIRKNIATKNLLKTKNKLCSKMKVKTEWFSWKMYIKQLKSSKRNWNLYLDIQDLLQLGLIGKWKVFFVSTLITEQIVYLHWLLYHLLPSEDKVTLWKQRAEHPLMCP